MWKYLHWNPWIDFFKIIQTWISLINLFDRTFTFLINARDILNVSLKHNQLLRNQNSWWKLFARHIKIENLEMHCQYYITCFSFFFSTEETIIVWQEYHWRRTWIKQENLKRRKAQRHPSATQTKRNLLRKIVSLFKESIMVYFYNPDKLLLFIAKMSNWLVWRIYW